MRRCTFAVIAVLLILSPWHGGVHADESGYTVRDLGTLDGLVPTVTGLNASGQVSGYVSSPGPTVDDPPVTRAVRYSNGRWSYLPGLEVGSAAYGINVHGDVTGLYVAPGGGTLAFRYTDAGGVEPIGPLPDGSFTVGRAINESGEVVGYGDMSGAAVAFRARPGQDAQILPSLGGPYSVACGINDAGQIVGSSLNGDNFQHLIRIDLDGTVVDASTFDGWTGDSSGCAIDAQGRFGGKSTLNGAYHALRFFDGAMLDLDSFGATFSIVEGISEGTSVGWYVPANGVGSRGFIHTDAKGSLDLNTLTAADSGWVLERAKAVTAGGQIAGEGTLNGVPTTFLLIAPAADTTAPVFTSLTASPATIWPPKGQTVTVTLTAVATDNSGETPACTLSSIAAPGAGPDDVNVTGPNSGTVRAVGGRTYTFNEQCADAAGNVARSSVNVVVPPDTTAPVIAALSARPSTVGPPNGALVSVRLALSASDDVDDAPACGLTSISSTGTAADDSAITGPLSARLRAVGGRTYTLNVRCSDAAGNVSNASTSVFVPPDTTAPAITAMSATPSVIWPPKNQMVPVSIAVSATDNVDDAPSCSLTSITGTGAPASDYMITGRHTGTVRAVGGRTYVFTETCVDAARNAASSSVRVVVPADVTAPVIGSISVNPNSVWPPNNKMVPVVVSVSASDDVDDAPSCSVTSVQGGAAGDSRITGGLSAEVRASKNSDGSGRVYTLKVNCTDRAGNTSTACIFVYIWKDAPVATTTAAATSNSGSGSSNKGKQ